MVEASFRKMGLTFYECLNAEDDFFARIFWVTCYTRTQFWGWALFFFMLSYTDDSLETSG